MVSVVLGLLLWQASQAPQKTHHQLGVELYRKGELQQAQQELASAISENPNDREAVQLRGLALFSLGRPVDAIPLLKQVQAWTPQPTVESAYALALAYIQTQNYEEARKQAALMYSVTPDSAGAHLFTARLLLRQGHDPIAEQFAQKAVTLDPKLPLAHFLLGEFYLYKSEFDHAATEFRQEISVNPAYAGTYDRLADTYSRQGRYDEADPLLRRAILLDANATGPYILMGRVQLKKQDYVQAEQYLTRALKMDANNYMTHNLLGQTYRAEGRAGDAERELKTAEQLQSAQHPQFEDPR